MGAISLVVTKGTTPTTLGYSFQDSGINFVKVESMSSSGRFLPDKLVRISAEAHDALERSKLALNDVLFTIAGTIGRTAIVTGDILPANTNQAVAIVRPNPALVLPRFLRYVLANPAFVNGALSRTVESVQANFSLGELKGANIRVPELGEQETIADVLGSLDDRIDLLRQTNATLESIARALFKSWFIDFDPVRAKAEGREPEGMDAATAALFPAEFEESALGLIPKGWRVGSFGNLAVLGKGSVNPMDFPTSTFEHYSLPAFDAGQLPVLEEGAAIKSNKTRIPSAAVLQSKLNPHIPRVWLIGDADERAVCSTEFLPWVAREGASPSLIYCTLRSPSFEAQVRTLVTGTSNSHQRVT